MNAVAPPPRSTIGRITFAIRLLIGFVVAIFLSVLWRSVLTSTDPSNPRWTAYLTIAAYVLTGVALVVGISKYLFIPRLRNIGFSGVFLGALLLLCVFPATVPFLVLLLLVLPPKFVRSSADDV